jgi:hypothetical protein
MSDIPLHSLRRNKNRGQYIPLLDSDTSSNPTSSHMPFRNNVTAIASNAAHRNQRRGNAKRSDMYSDDLEEQAGLLGRTNTRDEEEDEQAEQPMGTSQVS